MPLTIIGNNVDEVYVVSIFIVKLGFNYPLCCFVPGSWSSTLALNAKLTCLGGCWGEPFQSVAHLEEGTMPGKGLLQLCPLESCIPVWHTVCSPLLIG